jgi:hypothetical protein
MKKIIMSLATLMLALNFVTAQTMQEEVARLRAENARLKKEVSGEKPVDRVWALVGMWSGAVDRNTESFAITADEWNLQWSHKGAGYFGIWVHDAAGRRYKALPISTIGGTVSESIMRGAGTYYLRIMVSGNDDWEVVVTANEPKPGGAVLDLDTVNRIYDAAQIKRWHTASRNSHFTNRQMPTWWALEKFAKKAVQLPPVDNAYRDWLEKFLELCRVKAGPRTQDAKALLHDLDENAAFIMGK